MDSTELRSKLDQFWGSEQFFRAPLIPFLYTEGVQFFIENAEAYWFLTDLGVLFTSKLTEEQKADTFFCVELLVKNGTAVLTIDDGDKHILLSHSYTYTDCPEGLWRFFLEGPEGERVLLLPSEH